VSLQQAIRQDTGYPFSEYLQVRRRGRIAYYCCGI